MSTVYRFKEAAHFRAGFNREMAAARLRELQQRDAGLSVEAIIEEGLQESSPLHPQFSFDADEALERAYRAEAMYIRRSFVTVTVMADGTEREVRAEVVVVDRDSQERRSIPTMVALRAEDYRAQVLTQALNDLLALRRKYAELQELARVFAAVDKIAAAHERSLKKAA